MPPYLFSILIADRPAGSKPSLPPAVARNVPSFKEQHPGMLHRLLDDDAIRAFLRDHMEADVLWAYDQLLPYAYRADLARLCLLYECGGVYADLSVFFHAGWPIRPGILSEIKNVSRLSYTQQLHDYADFAQDTGRSFTSYTRTDTYISGPLQNAIDLGLIDIKKAIP